MIGQFERIKEPLEKVLKVIKSDRIHCIADIFKINIHLMNAYGIYMYGNTIFRGIKYLPIFKQSLISSMTGITALIHP